MKKKLLIHSVEMYLNINFKFYFENLLLKLVKKDNF